MSRLAPYLVLLALALPFKGASQNQAQLPVKHPPEKGQIAIGLLLPDLSQNDVIKAAELAIEQANAAGGYMNQEFKLVIRTAEGFWGAGSKESVSLVYEDKVRAIIGALDGRNGHLAEQVASKSHLTYIESFATEPTLSQAFVPWFMRVVPNDNQQSAAILRQIKKEGGEKIGILSSEDYDTRYAVKSLTKAVARETGMSLLVIELDTTNHHQRAAIEKILSSDLDHLVFPFNANCIKDLIISLGRVNPGLKKYGTLHFTMGAEKRGATWKDYEGVCLVAPRFNKEQNVSMPDSRSSYTYDAVNLVINAIQRVGTERETITDYLSKSKFSKGVTGSISFDELGNRQSQPTLFRIENGVKKVIESPQKP